VNEGQEGRRRRRRGRGQARALCSRRGPRIFSASGGRLRRSPSQIELIEANVSPEEIAKRRVELRKLELADCERQGFEITVPSDYDWDTYAPWVVRLSEQTIWRRENGIPQGGYLPLTHVVIVHPDGGWGYLTAAHATGSDAPRPVAEL
jgi:hypothetical protein